MQTDKILTVPSGKVGDIIIKAYKDAGYKIKKPKYHKIKTKADKGILKTGRGILEDIKYNYYYDSIKARQ